MDGILIESPIDLYDFKPVKPSLTDHKSYNHFLNRAAKIFHEQLHTVDPRPYQWEYAALMCVRRENIMGYEQGVGKTIISILALATLYPLLLKEGVEHRPNSIHISVPSLLAAQRWIEDLGKFTNIANKFAVVISESQLINNKSPIVIYTHDFPKSKSKVKKGKSISHAISSRYKPSYLIIDEIHGVKGKSNRTEHLQRVRQASRRVLGLSGTLADGNLSQIHNVCQFVYGSRWLYKSAKEFSMVFSTKEKLASNYIEGDKVKNASSPSKYLQKLEPTKLPQYYEMLNQYVHRVLLSEPQVADFIRIPLTDLKIHKVDQTFEQREIMSQYLQHHRNHIERLAATKSASRNAEALQLIIPLIKAANSPPSGESNKIAKVIELVGNRQKTVIFCNYIDSSRIITQALERFYPSQVVRLYANDEVDESSLTPNQRLDVLYRFQHDESIKAGVFSLNLASEAIELTAASSIIYYCLPWSSIKLMQSVSRAVRPGNKSEEVEVHYIETDGCIDTHQGILARQKIKNSKVLLNYDFELELESSDLSPTEALRRLMS